MLVKKSMLKNRSTVARLSYKHSIMNIQALHDNRGGATRCPKGGFSERKRPPFVAQNMAFRCKSECLNVLRLHTQDWHIQANRRKILAVPVLQRQRFSKCKHSFLSRSQSVILPPSHLRHSFCAVLHGCRFGTAMYVTSSFKPDSGIPQRKRDCTDKA